MEIVFRELSSTENWLIKHYIVTNQKFILLEFVIEPVEPTAFISDDLSYMNFWQFVFIFTLDCTDNLTSLAPIHTLSIVSVMATRLSHGLDPLKFVTTQLSFSKVPAD